MTNQVKQLDNLHLAIALKPFAQILGEHYGKIVADVSAMLGRVKAEELKTERKEWKISAKCVLSSSDGFKIALPLNNPAAILLRFGMNLNELSKSGEMAIQAEIPKVCQAWVEQHKLNKSNPAPKQDDKPEPALVPK